MSECCCLFLDTDFKKVQKVQSKRSRSYPKATQNQDYTYFFDTVSLSYCR